MFIKNKVEPHKLQDKATILFSKVEICENVALFTCIADYLIFFSNEQQFESIP